MTTQAGVIRLLVVDDHPLVRQGLRALLGAQADMAVAGEADSGELAVAFLEEHRVEIALMDARMPGIGGVEATRLVRSRHPETKVLLITAFPELGPEALHAGASGCLLKTASGEGILAAIRAVHHGATVISDALAAGVAVRPDSNGARHASPLSRRELEVLALVARGLTNRAIARELRIGPRTVDQHVHSIFIKTGVTSRASALRYALEHELTGLDDARTSAIS